jgi:hypothetical protein
MTDLPPMPQMPKRVAKKKKPSIKAYCPADLKKAQDKKIAELDLASARLTIDQIVCLIAGVKFGPEEAALRLGWTVAQVESELHRPACEFTIKMMRDMLLTEIVRTEVRALRKKVLNKATIEERLIELAYLDPTETKGSIEGQVKALKTLGDLFGFAKPETDPLKNKSTDELQDLVRQGALILEGSAKTSPVQ